MYIIPLLASPAPFLPAGNTIKYIKLAASSNFGNAFSILIASAWLPFNPMRPIQLLTQARKVVLL